MIKVFDPKKHIDSILPAASDAVSKSASADSSGVAVMQTIRAVRGAVADYAIKQAMSPGESEIIVAGALKSLAASAASGDTKDAAKAATLGRAHTEVTQAATIRSKLQSTLSSFNPHVYANVAPISSEKFSAQAAALASWAGTLGAGDAHDYHFMTSVGNTAIGDSDSSVSGTHTRRDMMPFTTIVEAAETINDARMLRVVDRSAAGIENVFAGMALALDGAIPAGANFAEAAAALKNPLHTSAPSYATSIEFMAHIERTGHELKGLVEYVARHPERDTSKVRDHAELEEKFPLAYGALQGTQAFWVQKALSAEDQRFSTYAPFADLTLSTAARNANVVVAALDNTRRAARLLGDFFEQGTASMLPVGGSVIPGDDMYMAQLHLSTASARALATKDNNARNDAHAQGVASQSAFQIVNRALPNGSGEFRRDAMTRVEDVARKAARDAGAEFFREGGRGASGAAHVAVAYAPALLAALDPSSTTAKQNEGLVRTILANATLDDIAAICTDIFKLPAAELSGADLRDALYKANESDTWFASHLKPGAVDDKGNAVSIVPVKGETGRGLNAQEREQLSAMLALANITWMQGQAFRAESDPTRRDPYQRGGVYRPYNNLVAAQDNVMKAIYDVVKDLHELREKAGVAG